MPSPLQLLSRTVSEPIRHWVLNAFPRDRDNGIDYDQPRGDPGLFDPAGATWRIHADFPGMLAGGLAALTLQTLHPRALAAIWDHSSFRDDLLGRLRRTTAFVGGTTYAPKAQAEAMITRVRQIHARIAGLDQYGQPYTADDPDLLTWVHVTEAFSFLQGYRRYSHIRLPPGTADTYYNEVRRIAEALGAREVPASEHAVTEYFQRIQPELAFTERSRVVLELLSRVQLPVPAAGLSRDLFLLAGAALLPEWAFARLQRTPWQQRQARLAAHALWSIAPAFRAALKDGVASRACLRVGLPPTSLTAWPDTA